MWRATQFLGVVNSVLKASLFVFVHGSTDRIFQSIGVYPAGTFLKINEKSNSLLGTPILRPTPRDGVHCYGVHTRLLYAEFHVAYDCVPRFRSNLAPCLVRTSIAFLCRFIAVLPFSSLSVCYDILLASLSCTAVNRYPLL